MTARPERPTRGWRGPLISAALLVVTTVGVTIGARQSVADTPPIGSPAVDAAAVAGPVTTIRTSTAHAGTPQTATAQTTTAQTTTAQTTTAHATTVHATTSRAATSQPARPSSPPTATGTPAQQRPATSTNTSRTTAPKPVAPTSPAPKPAAPKPAAVAAAPVADVSSGDWMTDLSAQIDPGHTTTWVLESKGAWGASDGHTIYLDPDMPADRRFSVMVHEYSHVLQARVYGSIRASKAALSAIIGDDPSSVTANEGTADCMALMQGATWVNYGCDDRLREAAAALLAGRRP